MSNCPSPVVFIAAIDAHDVSNVQAAAVRICMSMCSMSGAPLRETDGGFARLRTQPT